MTETRTKHVGHVPDRRRIDAPFNFVPLPEQPYTLAGEHLPPALWFDDGRASTEDREETFSGVIRYTLRAETPLYTKGARPPTAEDGDDAAREFYHHGDPDAPRVPGSTPRGAIRAVLTVLSQGKLPQTKQRRFFYRTFGKRSDPIAKAYADEMQATGFPPPPAAMPGFLVRHGRTGRIVPTEQMRVRHTDFDFEVYQRARSGSNADQNHRPNKEHQYAPASVLPPGSWRGKGHPKAEGFKRGWSTSAPWRQGWVVITGPMARKACEYVFYKPDPSAPELSVPADVLADAESDDQITKFQKEAFASDGKFVLPAHVRGRIDAPPGLPVWYLTDDDGNVCAIGRAQYFRLRHSRNTEAAVPAGLGTHNNAVPDLPERIFGRVVKGDNAAETRQIRGRVRFTDARCMTDDPFYPPLNGTGTRGDRVPSGILSSPKPTAVQIYLTQPSADLGDLQHYSSKHAPEVRGFKRYWHKKGLSERQIFHQGRSHTQGTQETAMRPVRPGAEFEGTIHYDNLTKLELGALLTAIELPNDLRHQLGMGKPLGMGSVDLRITSVETIDRDARYRSWGPTAPESADPLRAEARALFESTMVEHANQHRDTKRESAYASFWDIPQMRQFRHLASWDNAPSAKQTAYADLNERSGNLQFRHRNVLPAPHQVAGAKNPYPSTAGREDNRVVAQAGGPAQATTLKDGSMPKVTLERYSGREWIATTKDGESVTVLQVTDRRCRSGSEVVVRIKNGKGFFVRRIR